MTTLKPAPLPASSSSACSSRVWLRRVYAVAVLGIGTCVVMWLSVLGHFGSLFRELPSSESIGVRLAANETHVFVSSQSNGTIPKLIHQSWKTANHIPSKFSPWMQSWRVHNPTWSYMFWDDADNLNLFETHYPKYASVARQVGKIHLADMTRYALLHHYGGVYADGDFESLKPFDDLVHMDLFLSFEPLVHSVLLEGATSPVLCNAILASIPGHPFWLEVLDNILATFEGGGDNRDPVSLTGPRMVHRSVQKYSSQQPPPSRSITLLDEEYFYPEVAYWNFANLNRRCENATDLELQLPIIQEACASLKQFPKGRYTNNTHAVHRWQCTWCRGDDTLFYVTLRDIFPDKVILRPKFYQLIG
ncbi:hypothetical protein DYB35_008046 [Aphanomyces astaci]|uniref:Alpha 1,4-glycosyltransferase domain-containing protein n=1 Tax=Aphanomyces astaci TaxID=112090 RepID=A0A418E0C4_APHAT|nr:hypothetical protein DYB35_008046 [Aphanomyces astaci]